MNISFTGNKNLKDVVISVNSYGDTILCPMDSSVFSYPITKNINGKRTEYRVEEFVTVIKVDQKNELTQVKISDAISKIDTLSFDGCMNLTNVVYFGNDFNDRDELIKELLEYGVSCTLDTFKNTGLDINKNYILYSSEDEPIFSNEWTQNDGSKTKIKNIFFKTMKQGKLIFDGSINCIPYSAFYECTNLKSIDFPDSIQEIHSGENVDYSPFYRCINLQSINLPNQIKKIPSNTFSGCKSMNRMNSLDENVINLPNSVTSIESSAFSGCQSIEKIVFPETLTYIGQYAFTGCKSLTELLLPDSLETIVAWSFGGLDNLTTLKFGKKLKKIGDEHADTWCFKNCPKLTNIELPETIEYIGGGVFENCSNIVSITYKNVTYTNYYELKKVLEENNCYVSTSAFISTSLDFSKEVEIDSSTYQYIHYTSIDEEPIRFPITNGWGADFLSNVYKEIVD